MNFDLKELVDANAASVRMDWGLLMEPKVNGTGEKASRRPSQATRLVQMILTGGVTLFHTPDETAFASLKVQDHTEHWPVNSKFFRKWMFRLFYEINGQAPSSQAISDAQQVLGGEALCNGEKEEVFIRLAQVDQAIYLDLGDEMWNVVEITANGWTVIQNPPVRFRRPMGMQALPLPQVGGTWTEFQTLFGVNGDAWILLVAALISWCRPRGPYVVLILTGEQGSGKSTKGRMLRTLVDPNKSNLRTEPRNNHDLMIAAKNGWLLAYDNLSKIPAWLSDGLCILSTGGGLSTRELYSDDNEIIFEAQRPILLTSIEDVVNRGDLLDRAVMVNLSQISDDARQPLELLESQFGEAQPRILGLLLNATSMALKNLDDVQLPSLPRMADFTKWVVAAEPALPWKPGAFLQAYTENRRQATTLALEASIVVPVLEQFVETQPEWEGTAQILLQDLNEMAPDDVKRQPAWPKKPNILTNQLKRITPNLRENGIQVTRLPRQGKSRPIRIEKICNVSSSPSFSSPEDITD